MNDFMNIDLTQLSEEDLNKMILTIRKELDSRKKHRVIEIRDMIRKAAEDLGMSQDELMSMMLNGRHGNRRSRGKVAPKYRNPNNPSETWTGRGKRPRWIESAISSGLTLDDLVIKNEGPLAA